MDISPSIGTAVATTYPYRVHGHLSTHRDGCSYCRAMQLSSEMLYSPVQRLWVWSCELKTCCVRYSLGMMPIICHAIDAVTANEEIDSTALRISIVCCFIRSEICLMLTGLAVLATNRDAVPATNRSAVHAAYCVAVMLLTGMQHCCIVGGCRC